MWLMPSRKQWGIWSLPSKLTAIGAYIGIAGILLAIAPLLIPYFLAPKKAHLAAELHFMIGSQRMRIANVGDVLATKINVDIVSWANGAPDATIRINREVRDLMPESDFLFDIDLLHHGGTTGIPPDEHRYSSSGYILVTCNNCDEPKAWAFYIPEDGHMDTVKRTTTSWPIVEFNYPEDKPRIGEVVNYPKQFDSYGWNPKEGRKIRWSE